MRVMACLVLLAACRGAAAPTPPANDFGLYLLAMTWEPSFCCSEAGHAECAQPTPQLTLHGLWPNYSDEQGRGKPHAWPQYCGALAHCDGAEDASCAPGVPVPDELASIAPGYVADPKFATHEWSKHGSCTGLAPADYFRAELAAIHAIPKLDVPAGDIALADLQHAFGVPGVALGCDPRCRLARVGFCLARDGVTPVACTDNITTSEYDNGCVTRGCARVAVQSTCE